MKVGICLQQTANPNPAYLLIQIPGKEVRPKERNFT